MKNALLYLKNLLLESNVPLWVTIVGILGGAVGAYVITPLLNQKLENQKIKTEYVIRSLDSINSKTQEMLSEISIVNRRIYNKNQNIEENIDKATRLVAELQWKAIEISAVLDDEKSLSILVDFQEKLDAVRSKIELINSPDSALKALAEIRSFIPASLRLVNRIASLSGIRFSDNLVSRSK
ncbi:hypothetical protein [Methylobacterium sp. Leaf123]|uniref:hypothetical protein n=1 Tax=Methylobacterium sp. Leaf123 TaxID=1736264 RepID=UPI0012E717C9|nr:hypothetical protein [Methylobacterium sp. Leaf123]